MTEPAEFHGPYVAAAFICEQVIEGKDGVFSYIREIDRLTITARGPGAPVDFQPTDVQFKLVLHLKSGDARGRIEVHVEPEPPSGIRKERVGFPMLLEGDDRGARLVLDMRLRIEEEGLHWFNIYTDGRPITRVPLRLVYQRLSTAPA